MLALLLLLAVGISQVMSRKLHESLSSMSERHEQWIAKHSKVYKDAAEKEKRFMIFKNNVNYIESFNAAGNKPYKLSVNQLADLTLQEFKASRNGYKKPHEFITTSFKYENVAAIPAAVDWRLKGAVTPIKDQGDCGKINNIIYLCTLLYTYYCETTNMVGRLCKSVKLSNSYICVCV